MTGSEIVTGSSIALCRQLDELNNRTWKADALMLRQWRLVGADFGGRFAFAVFRKLAEESVVRRLPMMLDY